MVLFLLASLEFEIGEFPRIGSWLAYQGLDVRRMCIRALDRLQTCLPFHQEKYRRRGVSQSDSSKRVIKRMRFRLC